MTPKSEEPREEADKQPKDDEWRTDRQRWDFDDDYGEPRDEQFHRWEKRGEDQKY